MVKEVIPLKGKTGAPSFGIGSPGSDQGDESQTGRSIVVCGFPQNFTNSELTEIFTSEGYALKLCEVLLLRLHPSHDKICKNPDGKPRTCGIIELHSREETDILLKSFKCSKYPNLYLNPLWYMAFPDVVGGSCSL
jgi:hypothetical protein